MNDLVAKRFDEQGAEAELKKCPEIVQEYVKQLKGSADNWKNICADAVNKLRNASKNNGVSHGVSHFWQHPKNFIMQKIREILKELNGQPTERTDKIVTWWIIFCCVALMTAAYCG